MINLFCGFDSREAIGWHVFVDSVLRNTSKPVAIHRLDACGLPQGSNAFTMSRFLVPWLMNYQGHAIFADGADMLMVGDIAELDAMFNPDQAVQVVHHDYKTRNPRKYVGTSMECDNPDYDRKNWASLMIFNCAHPLWSDINPEYLETANKLDLLQLRGGVPYAEVGALPSAWNRIVDEGQPVEGAKVLHWTAGVPCFPHYRNAPGADLWFAEHDQMIALP